MNHHLFKRNLIWQIHAARMLRSRPSIVTSGLLKHLHLLFLHFRNGLFSVPTSAPSWCQQTSTKPCATLCCAVILGNFHLSFLFYSLLSAFNECFHRYFHPHSCGHSLLVTVVLHQAIYIINTFYYGRYLRSTSFLS